MAVTTQDVVPFLTHVFITRVGYITMVLLKLVQFQGPTPYKKNKNNRFYQLSSWFLLVKRQQYVSWINYDVFLQTAIHFAVLEIAPADGFYFTFCFTPPLFLRHTTSLSLVSSTISIFLATTIFIIFGWIMHHDCWFFSPLVPP